MGSQHIFRILGIAKDLAGLTTRELAIKREAMARLLSENRRANMPVLPNRVAFRLVIVGGTLA
jgi:hypothetical protein